MSMPSTQFHAGLLHPRHWPLWIFLGLFFLVTRLPVSWLDRIGARLGRVLMKHNRKRVNIVTTNLQACFPDKSAAEITQMVTAHFELVMIAMMHYGLIWWSSDRRLEKMLQRVGFEQIDQAYNDNKNVIILLSHCTGLEFAVFAVIAAHHGAGPYKPFPNAVIDWLVLRSRSKHDCKPFRREDGLRPIIRYAKQKLPIIYLADEDLGPDVSVFADFFNTPKATIPLLGRLTKACDARVFPAIACYDRKTCTYQVKLLQPDPDFPQHDQQTDAQAMNRMIERTVLECATQYFWTLKIFKTRPEGEQSFY